MVDGAQQPLSDLDAGCRPNHDLPLADLTLFLENVQSATPVVGATHNFYRYPARFSPQFAKSAISLFTSPGDTVFDPFTGGGTTAVESLLAGRRFVGCDLNALAHFVAKVKTTPLRDRDVAELTAWGEALPSRINLHKRTPRHEDWEKYQKNVPWWLRKLLEAALDDANCLERPRTVNFARCSLLRTSQWAMDCRKEIPTAREFLRLHGRFLTTMLRSIANFTNDLKLAGGKASHARIFGRSSVGIETEKRLPKQWMPPRLVLTSPPYVGVHVLYHRWQVRGRRETAAPYWVAGCQDGHGGAYYTFADRRNTRLEPYLEQLGQCFKSVAQLLDERSLVVQLVAFSNPEKQLEAYLSGLNDVGLEEVNLGSELGTLDRIWRRVPNRKWYANLKPQQHASNELLLVHRLKRT